MCVCAYTFRSNISIKSLLIGISLLCAYECYNVGFSFSFFGAYFFIFISFHILLRCVLVSQFNYANFAYKCFGKSFHGNLRCNNEPHGSDTDQATKFSPFIFYLSPSHLHHRKAIKKCLSREKVGASYARLNKMFDESPWTLSKQRANNFKLRSIIKLSRHCCV